MPQKIRVWEVGPSVLPREMTTESISLEEHLENWLENDISMVDEDLLVIGRQVPTSYGGIIDLLCIDSSGSLVVVELKRRKTPRDVAAQALDYAAWAKDLSRDYIEKLAADHLKAESFDAAFRDRFDLPLPDVLNGAHRVVVVAESIDETTERIVRYLADFGVPINAATVQCFKDREERVLLAQVYLVELDEAESKAQAAPGRQRATTRERQALAEKHGNGELFAELEGLHRVLGKSGNSREYVFYTCRTEGGRRTVLKVWTVRQGQDDGMRYELHVGRLQAYMGMTKEQLQSALPSDAEEDTGVRQWHAATLEEQKDAIGLRGVFREVEEVRKLVEALGAAVERKR